MLEQTPIDRLYAEATLLVDTLSDMGEVSLSLNVKDSYGKALFLAAASFYEHKLCEALADYVQECSPRSRMVANFVRNKAISRQFHTWFDWDARNVNKFYKLFGHEFYEYMKNSLVSRDKMDVAATAFLHIGNERNRLVHQNYAGCSLNNTLDEIYDLYKDGAFFVDHLVEALRGCDLACSS